MAEMMLGQLRFCSACGAEVRFSDVAGDNKKRFVCTQCGIIHYTNPKIVVGALAYWEDKVLLCRRAIEPRYGYWNLPAGYLEDFEKQTISQTVSLMEKYDKPIVGVYLLNDDKTRTIMDVNGCKYKGVNFISPERAVKALGKMYKYTQWLKD